MDNHSEFAEDGGRETTNSDGGQHGKLVTTSEDAPGEVTGSRVRSHDTNDELSTEQDGSQAEALQRPLSNLESASQADNRDSAAAQTATQNLVAALEKHRSPQAYVTDSGRTSEARSMPPHKGQSRFPRLTDNHELANLESTATPLPVADPRNATVFSGCDAEYQSGLRSAYEVPHHSNDHDHHPSESLPGSHGHNIAGVVAENECAQSVEEEEIPQAIIDAQSYGRVPAYAKLVFPDGLYYMTTLYLTLGRDVLALKAAQENYGDRSQRNSRGAERDQSRPANSLVSREGGINGFDHDQNSEERGNAFKNSQTSSSSGHGTVAPQQLQKKKPFDYDKRIKITEEAAIPSRKREAPKTVDTQSLLPNHNEKPLLPIHPRADLDGAEEIAGHKAISRRHLQIGWNDEMARFESECLGVNGYYLNGQFRPQRSVDSLESNAVIEINGIDIRWELPQELIPEIELVSDVESVSPDNVFSEGEADSANEAIESIETPDQPIATKRKSKPSAKKESLPQPPDAPTASAQPEQLVKRKRGRPPKGPLPQRVLAERRREEKAAKAREGNGGVTPPPKPPKRPVGRPKQNKDEQTPAPKPEKRKYTKRKREDDEHAEASNQADGADGEDGPVDDAKVKKQLDVLVANLPSLDTYTEEQKERPKLPYKHLIYQEFVKDPTPKNLTGVYAALVVTHPFFRTLTGSGWQSSVRHNLLGEKHLFEGIETEGRGKLWKLRDGAVLEPATKRRISPPPSSLSRNRGPPMTNGISRTPTSYMGGGPPPNYPPNGPNGVYGMPPGGQYPPPGAMNGMPQPNGAFGQQMPPANEPATQAGYQYSSSMSPNAQSQGGPSHPPNGYQQTSPLQNRFTNGHVATQAPPNTTQQPTKNPNEPPHQLINFIASFHSLIVKDTSPSQREEIDGMLEAVRSIVLRGQRVDTSKFSERNFEALLTHVRNAARSNGWLDGKKWPESTKTPVPTQAGMDARAADGAKSDASAAKEAEAAEKTETEKADETEMKD